MFRSLPKDCLAAAHLDAENESSKRRLADSRRTGYQEPPRPNCLCLGLLPSSQRKDDVISEVHKLVFRGEIQARKSSNVSYLRINRYPKASQPPNENTSFSKKQKWNKHQRSPHNVVHYKLPENTSQSSRSHHVVPSVVEERSIGDNRADDAPKHCLFRQLAQLIPVQPGKERGDVGPLPVEEPLVHSGCVHGRSDRIVVTPVVENSSTILGCLLHELFACEFAEFPPVKLAKVTPLCCPAPIVVRLEPLLHLHSSHPTLVVGVEGVPRTVQGLAPRAEATDEEVDKSGLGHCSDSCAVHIHKVKGTHIILETRSDPLAHLIRGHLPRVLREQLGRRVTQGIHERYGQRQAQDVLPSHRAQFSHLLVRHFYT
eukprot:m.381247 g.381247  ORF g.381247 m.381247 type:complete len:372 (-) comp16714_c0_seq3:451-1566(-)